MTQHMDPYIKDEFDSSDIDFNTLCRDMEFGSMREESLCARINDPRQVRNQTVVLSQLVLDSQAVFEELVLNSLHATDCSPNPDCDVRSLASLSRLYTLTRSTRRGSVLLLFASKSKHSRLRTPTTRARGTFMVDDQ